jgi:hypothetical protein
MKKILVSLIMLCSFLVNAELSVQNEKDRLIFAESRILASQLLVKSAKDKLGNDLLKFSSWMNAKDQALKAMKLKLVFQDKITVFEGTASKSALAGKLIERQADFVEEISKRLLYISIAYQLDPVKAKSLKEEFSKFDMTFSKLLKNSTSPKLVDLEVEAAEMKRQEEENKLLDSSDKSSESEMDLILDGVKLESFSYSESSAVYAINTLTHNLFWRGCQMTITGKRLHYVKTTTSTAGALFYISPMPLPVKETYTLKKQTIRQILEHMSVNLKILWSAHDAGVTFYDSKDKSLIDTSEGDGENPIEVTEDGIVSKDLQKVMRGMKLSDLQKYRGKVLEMNGQITGFGRGFGNEYYISIDGGLTRLNFNTGLADSKILKRLKVRVDKWKADGGLKAMREKERELEKNAEDIDRASLSDPKLFVNFKALCYSVDRGRLIFKNPEAIFIKATGEYLIKPKDEVKQIEN